MLIIAFFHQSAFELILTEISSECLDLRCFRLDSNHSSFQPHATFRDIASVFLLTIHTTVDISFVRAIFADSCIHLTEIQAPNSISAVTCVDRICTESSRLSVPKSSAVLTCCRYSISFDEICRSEGFQLGLTQWSGTEVDSGYVVVPSRASRDEDEWELVNEMVTTLTVDDAQQVESAVLAVAVEVFPETTSVTAIPSPPSYRDILLRSNQTSAAASENAVKSTNGKKRPWKPLIIVVNKDFVVREDQKADEYYFEPTDDDDDWWEENARYKYSTAVSRVRALQRLPPKTLEKKALRIKAKTDSA